MKQLLPRCYWSAFSSRDRFILKEKCRTFHLLMDPQTSHCVYFTADVSHNRFDLNPIWSKHGVNKPCQGKSSLPVCCINGVRLYKAADVLWLHRIIFWRLLTLLSDRQWEEGEGESRLLLLGHANISKYNFTSICKRLPVLIYHSIMDFLFFFFSVRQCWSRRLFPPSSFRDIWFSVGGNPFRNVSSH